MSDMSNNMKRWVAEAKEKGATHVLDVCDSFDYEHYPVYVMPNEKVSEVASKYNAKDMQSVYGTYNIEENIKLKDKCKDENLNKLYKFFNGFAGSEEFYVGDIKSIILELDKKGIK